MDICLQKWSLNDKERLKELCNSVDRTYLSNRMPFPYTDDDADWWLDMISKNDGNNGIFRSIVVNSQIIGSVSVEKLSDVRAKDAEIGYYIDKNYWSRGIVTQAVNQICEIAFNELDIIRITGLVYEPNVASKKVLEKNGFMLEGTLKNAVTKEENIFNLLIYGKTK